MDDTKVNEGDVNAQSGRNPQSDADATSQDTNGTPTNSSTDTQNDRGEWKKLISDARAEAGRYRVSVEKLQSELALERQLREEAELAPFKDDPEKYNARKAELKTRQKELEVNSKLKDITEREIRINAKDISSKYEGVDWNDLVDLTDGTPEKMENLAKRIGKQVKPNTQEPAKKNPEIPHADSGRGAGGGRTYTHEEIADYDFFKANKEDILKAREEGRIK